VHAALGGRSTENIVVDPPDVNGLSDGSVMVATPFRVEADADVDTVAARYKDHAPDNTSTPAQARKPATSDHLFLPSVCRSCVVLIVLPLFSSCMCKTSSNNCGG
jgi:hypothetical protein